MKKVILLFMVLLTVSCTKEVTTNPVELPEGQTELLHGQFINADGFVENQYKHVYMNGSWYGFHFGEDTLSKCCGIYENECVMCDNRGDAISDNLQMAASLQKYAEQAILNGDISVSKELNLSSAGCWFEWGNYTCSVLGDVLSMYSSSGQLLGRIEMAPGDGLAYCTTF